MCALIQLIQLIRHEVRFLCFPLEVEDGDLALAENELDIPRDSLPITGAHVLHMYCTCPVFLADILGCPDELLERTGVGRRETPKASRHFAQPAELQRGDHAREGDLFERRTADARRSCEESVPCLPGNRASYLRY